MSLKLVSTERPDLVFPGPRVVVFVDGDFWHGRNWPVLKSRLEKRANPGYWVPKIARNIERDREQTAILESAGWRVIRLWETDVLRDHNVAAEMVAGIISNGVARTP
jgi:DNA mismatch endonuclease (patch repair protein)